MTPTRALAAASDAPADLAGLNLVQYGAIGMLLVAFVVFSFRAWQRECARSDRQEAEHRADRERLENENRRLHADIQEKAIPALLSSATALTEVTELLREQQRQRWYDYAPSPRKDGDL